MDRSTSHAALFCVHSKELRDALKLHDSVQDRGHCVELQFKDGGHNIQKFKAAEIASELLKWEGLGAEGSRTRCCSGIATVSGSRPKRPWLSMESLFI